MFSSQRSCYNTEERLDRIRLRIVNCLFDQSVRSRDDRSNLRGISDRGSGSRGLTYHIDGLCETGNWAFVTLSDQYVQPGDKAESVLEIVHLLMPFVHITSSIVNAAR